MGSPVPLVPNYAKGDKDSSGLSLYYVPQLLKAHETNDYKSVIDMEAKGLFRDILGPWGDFCELNHENILESLTEIDFDLKSHINVIESLCQIVAQHATRPYDVEYSTTATKTRTKTIKVPKKRKAGLFRTETYYDTETKTESYNEEISIRYAGWFVERLRIQFERIAYGCDVRNQTLHIDYCLGSDGKLYTIAYLEDVDAWEPLIMECTHLSPRFMGNTSMNVLTQVLAGSMGVLDYIPAGGSDSNNVIKYETDSYEKSMTFNFPVQIDDVSECFFELYAGALCRILQGGLLDEPTKYQCAAEYPLLLAFF